MVKQMTKLCSYGFFVLIYFCSFAFAGCSSNCVSNRGENNKGVTKKVEKKIMAGMTMRACRAIDFLKTKRKVVALTFDDGTSRKIYSRDFKSIKRKIKLEQHFLWLEKMLNLILT